MISQSLQRRLAGKRVRVSEGSGILSAYTGRVANESERFDYIQKLRTEREYYTLSLIRDSEWIVCVFDTAHGRPLQLPHVDCMAPGRIVEVR